MRPVNIIQHDDAGDAPEDEGHETIELPPAYNNIRKGPRASTVSVTDSNTGDTSYGTAEPGSQRNSAAVA